MSGPFQRLLKPTSIAVFGGKEAAVVIAQTKAMGFSGDIWPVHPNKNQVGGLKTFTSVYDLPRGPDAAYIAVNRERTIGIVAELAKLGAGGAICYASGFAEADAAGQSLQRALVVAAGEMPVIGPNCYGLLNYADSVALWPDQHGGVPLAPGKTGVAIITQSSNIAINLTMQQRGLPIAYVMTAGNQAQTGLSELALALLDDDRVSVLGLHIEGFDSIIGMEAVARKSRQLRKPVVALKIGASAQARQATLTHTASISRPDHGVNAFFERIGIARVHSLPSFLETLKLLHVTGSLDGYNISSLSCSGGEAALMADAAMGRKVCFRELSQAEKQPVQEALGPMVTVSNPLDYHTYIWGDRAGIEATFTGMMNAGFDLNCLVMDFPRQDRCESPDWQISVKAWAAATTKTGSKSCVLASLHENINEAQAIELMELGIAPLIGIPEAFDAIEAAAQIGLAWGQDMLRPIVSGLADAPERKCTRILDEGEGKKLLAKYRVSVPDGGRFSDMSNLTEIIAKIGFPVALKALGVAHKAEQHAVALNLTHMDAVREVAGTFSKLGKPMYVEAMVQEPILELLVGVLRDAQFGLIMTIASGGTMVEVLNDSQTLLMPFGKSDVEDKLRQLKSAVFFDGFRGGRKASFSATVKAILAIQDFAMDNCDRLEEVDINPLIVCEQDTVAADVLIKFNAPNLGVMKNE